MDITRIFIARPIMTTLVMVAILLFGIIGYTQLPVSDLPSVDFPVINVSASLPGANPETMASAVATPLEQQFTTIAGIQSMNSSSSLGSTQITLQFDLSRSLDGAAQDVQAAISTALRRLPPNMPSPPSLRKVNPADQPIIYLAFSSKYLAPSQVDDYAETMMAQRISMVDGVAQVNINGSQKYAVRVQLDPTQLARRGIGIDEVNSAIQTGNVYRPLGALYGNYMNYTVKDNGQITNATGFNNLIVAYRNGAPVRLRDVGIALDSVEQNKILGLYNDTPAIVLAVQRQPGTNTIEIINRIKALLPTFKDIIPPSVHLDVFYDRSITIRNAVSDVEFTLLLTVFLVIGVIYVFLRNNRATLISSLSLPMSVIGTFAAMALLHFSLDNFSLMALTLSVGFVVDDAIVMLENITRHMEMGEAALPAAIKGAQEIGFTILSMTISLVAVFIPVLFMGGLIGRLFNEFALTITCAILISGFISLSLTPMLCSRFLKPEDHTQKKNKVLEASEATFNKIYTFYEWSLTQAMHHRKTVMLSFVGLIILTVLCFGLVSKGFMPTEDTGLIFGSTEAAQGVSYKEMQRHHQELVAIIKKEPGVKDIFSFTDTNNTGRIVVSLIPRNKRHKSSEEIIQTLRPKIEQVAGIKLYLQTPPTIRLTGQLTKSLYQLTLQSPNTDDLYPATTALYNQMKKIPGLLDVNTDMLIKNPQLVVNINRDKASELGVTADQVENALSSAYGSGQVSLIYAPTNSYQVIVELKPEFQDHPEVLSLLYVRSMTGKLVPLNTVASISKNVGILSVNHLGQFPSTTISFNLEPGIALGQKVHDIQAVSDKILPSTVKANFQGMAQAFQSSSQGLVFLLIIAVLVIYIVLGILYESFIHPITILSGLLPAGFGALVTLMLFNKDLDIYGFLGLIMLIGIVKKNAIMMIDFALDLQRTESMVAETAIYKACLIRFRPIMMTTLAALMGVLPIAIGIGASSESRQPLGLAVFGGLVVSQILTLYITPVIYTYLDQFKDRFQNRRRQHVQPA